MNIPIRRWGPLALALLWAQTPVAAAIDILVNPSDGQAGLTQALSRARDARAQNKGKPQAIRIVLKAGTYVLAEPWVITSTDSGTPDAPLVIEPETPGSVTLTGGPALPLAEQQGQRWIFNPPQGVDRVAERMGGQMYVNGKRATLAREPKAGSWWFVQASSKDELIMSAADATRLSDLLDKQRERAIINLMQSWTSGQHRVGSDISSTNSLKLQPSPKWPMLMYGSAQRYYVENVPGALNAPGEWIAMDDHLVYLPRPEDAQLNGKSVSAVWPRVPTLIKLQGDNETDRRVHDVQIKGLKLAYTGALTSLKGWVDGQAAVDVGAAIEIDRTHNVWLTQCDIRHTGGYGVWIKGSASHADVTNCVMDDLGAGGIKIGMPVASGSPTRVTDHNTIKGNLIMHTGQVYPGAVGVWVGHASDNLIANNVIGHTSYTGISVGWTWGYEDQAADNNQIKDNVLFDIGQGTLSDMGGIYTLGRGQGTVVSGNLIRQVQDYPFYGAGAWGIYNDEGTSGLLMDSNVVVGTRSGGYHLHYGRDNVVRTNLFADGTLAEMRWSNPEKSGNWQAKDNATTGKKGVRDLDMNGAPDDTRLRMGFKSKEAGPNKVNVRTGSAIADVSISGGTDQQQVAWSSVISKAQATLKAAATAFPQDQQWLLVTPLPSPPAKPALSWRWRFDELPEGPPPTGLRYAPMRSDGLVKIALDPAPGATGRCLLLTDGTPGAPRYEPYVYLLPDMPLDRATAEFEVKLDARSVLIHEWRNTVAQPYQTILKFTLSGQQGLLIGGKPLAALPTGEWLKAKVQVNASANTWSLDLAGAKGALGHWDALPLITPDQPQLGWVGWISDTDQVSQACIKRIDVHPHGG